MHAAVPAAAAGHTLLTRCESPVCDGAALATLLAANGAAMASALAAASTRRRFIRPPEWVPPGRGHDAMEARLPEPGRTVHDLTSQSLSCSWQRVFDHICPTEDN